MNLRDLSRLWYTSFPFSSFFSSFFSSELSTEIHVINTSFFGSQTLSFPTSWYPDRLNRVHTSTPLPALVPLDAPRHRVVRATLPLLGQPPGLESLPLRLLPTGTRSCAAPPSSRLDVRLIPRGSAGLHRRHSLRLLAHPADARRVARVLVCVATGPLRLLPTGTRSCAAPPSSRLDVRLIPRGS